MGGSKMDRQATPPDEPKLGPRMQQVWPLMVAALFVGYLLFPAPDISAASKTVSYSEIRDLIKQGEIDEATLQAAAIIGHLTGPTDEGAETVRAILP
ncbi:ATP-dependent metallopeptidase FtsH/Yme1/Tma family protein, partial [uncultured Boseongicola sp.]|uniref:ATP-dependent metallopeptidase FtsH/Yme1/Tma family protein n=1 Tax=uncultured Boseongicola sp. TaxID=1648499 RepID=UPI0034333DD6